MSVANISFFIQVALHKNKEAKAERDKKQVKRPASLLRISALIFSFKFLYGLPTRDSIDLLFLIS